jgi:holin-like protein
MIPGIGLLLGFALAGEVGTRVLQVPIPGPIIGLLILFAWLQSRSFTDLKTPEAVEATELAQVATPLLRNLAILFVPSGVGVLQYFGLFARHGLALLVVLVASTLIAMVATALAFVAAQSLAARLRVSPRLLGRADRRARPRRGLQRPSIRSPRPNQGAAEARASERGAAE